MFRGKLKWIFILGLVITAGYVVATDERFENLIDPTTPLNMRLDAIDSTLWGSRVSEVVQKMTGSYKVSSILVRGDQAIAYLNGEKVSVGSKIDGVVVVGIDRDGVVLRRGIEEFRVNLRNEAGINKAVKDG